MREPPPLPFATRFWLAWACFFRILLDGVFARAVKDASEVAAGHLPAPNADEAARPAKEPVPALAAPPARVDAALQLLALFQREGRLVDFLEQDITGFPDADVGAAARVVHDGCAKALRAHARVVPVRPEDEGAPVALEAGFSPAEVKLSGNVGGSPPYRGVVRHRGWRAEEIHLPTPMDGHDASILAPAEVEL